MMEPLLLHSNHPLTWRAWHPEPVLVGALILAGGLYLRSASSAKPPWWRILAFFAGLFFVFVALGSPLDVGAGRLFSLHMLQHVILSTWAPPLILLGLTPFMLRPILHTRWLGPIMRIATHPLVGAPAFILNMWVWHVPPVYDLAANFSSVHYTMHLSFLATGVLFWWTVISPAWEVHRFSTGARLFYIFFTGFPMMLLAFMLVATPSPLYDYYESQQPLWGISAITDQQIGGAIMGTLGELTMIIPFTLLFIRLLSEDEEDHERAQLGLVSLKVAPPDEEVSTTSVMQPRVNPIKELELK